MTADIAYHLTELKIVSNKGDPRRIVPNYSCGGWRVLDIGCGIGQTLVSEELSEATELYGVDSDSELVNCPRTYRSRTPTAAHSCCCRKPAIPGHLLRSCVL